MTICSSVKVRDGLVLATDSMTTIQGKDAATGQIGVVKTYSNATKLFQLRDLPIGIMAYGAGNIGDRSIQGFMREFGNSVVPTNVKAATASLFKFINSAYGTAFKSLKVADRPPLGFFVAGYSDKKNFAEEWEFLLPRDKAPKPVRPETGFGASWRGINLPFTRIYRGFDPRIAEKLKAAGLNDKTIKDVLGGFESPIVFDGMPVQDAVNFAAFIVRTTIGMATFEAGPSSCGGPLQVATILQETGFEWVLEPTIGISEP